MGECGEPHPALVIETGSAMVKAGFAGMDCQRAEFPTIVGRVKMRGMVMVGYDSKVYYVGDEAEEHKKLLRLRRPVEHGIVTNWDNIEKILHHTFYNELRVGPEEHPVLLAEAVDNPSSNRERMTQLMFETWDVPHLCLQSTAQLALYAAGRVEGCVVESGLATTRVSCLQEQKLLSSQRLDQGGNMVTSHLSTALINSKYEVQDAALVEDIKQRSCRCSPCPRQRQEFSFACGSHPRLGVSSPLRKLKHIFPAASCRVKSYLGEAAVSYEMPDGSRLSLDGATICSPDVLFQDGHVGVGSSSSTGLKKCSSNFEVGLHQLVHRCVHVCMCA